MKRKFIQVLFFLLFDTFLQFSIGQENEYGDMLPREIYSSFIHKNKTNLNKCVQEMCNFDYNSFKMNTNFIMYVTLDAVSTYKRLC